eukprot:UN28143
MLNNEHDIKNAYREEEHKQPTCVDEYQPNDLNRNKSQKVVLSDYYYQDFFVRNDSNKNEFVRDTVVENEKLNGKYMGTKWMAEQYVRKTGSLYHRQKVYYKNQVKYQKQ